MNIGNHKALDSFKILLVEDDDACRNTIQTVILAAGGGVTAFSCAEDAIKHIPTSPVDAVITDIKLPGMDGIELLRRIRLTDSDLPVVIITGYSSVGSAVEALKLGAQDYILKPFSNPSKLIRAVSSYIRNHRLVLKNRSLQEALIESERKIATACENEQRKLGHEIHDVLCQDLASISMLASVIKQSKNDPDELRDLDMILDISTRSIQFCRNLCAGTLSGVGQNESLDDALEHLALYFGKVSSINCSFSGDNASRCLDSSSMFHVYRIAQEAMNNAVKHGKPSSIAISLASKNGNNCLTVEDDGSGFDVEKALSNGIMGLHIMKYRARMIGAALDISSSKTNNTKVTCTWHKDT